MPSSSLTLTSTAGPWQTGGDNLALGGELGDQALAVRVDGEVERRAVAAGVKDGVEAVGGADADKGRQRRRVAPHVLLGWRGRRPRPRRLLKSSTDDGSSGGDAASRRGDGHLDAGVAEDLVGVGQLGLVQSVTTGEEIGEAGELLTRYQPVGFARSPSLLWELSTMKDFGSRGWVLIESVGDSTGRGVWIKRELRLYLAEGWEVGRAWAGSRHLNSSSSSSVLPDESRSPSLSGT